MIIQQCVSTNMFWNHIFMYKGDLALNNQQCLICHRIQPSVSRGVWLFVVFGMMLNFWCESSISRNLGSMKSSLSLLTHPKVAQPKLGAFQPRICHWSIPHLARMPDSPAKAEEAIKNKIGLIYIKDVLIFELLHISVFEIVEFGNE